MKRDDNRGFSLVELIIVIAIMVIILGMLGASLNFIGNSQARSLANSIKTAIGQTRIQTMGKYDSYLYIYRDPSDDKYYKKVWKRSNLGILEAEDREAIGKQKPIVKYYIEGDTSTEHILDGSHGLLIKFDRTNGKEVEAILPTGTYTDENGIDIDTGIIGAEKKSVKCDKIVVSFGGKEYVITIVPATGKIHL